MARLALYEDSSDDELGENGSSLYWQLPPEHRGHYRQVLQATRRARNRLAYVQHLDARGVAASDAPAVDVSAATRASTPVAVPAMRSGAPDAPAPASGEQAAAGAAAAKHTGHHRQQLQQAVELPLVPADSLAVELLQGMVQTGTGSSHASACCV